MARFTRRFPHRRSEHSDAGNVIAVIDRKPLRTGFGNLRPPRLEAWRLVPAQRPEPPGEFGLGIVAERCDAPARGTDQRREPATDLGAELEIVARAGDGHR